MRWYFLIYCFYILSTHYVYADVIGFPGNIEETSPSASELYNQLEVLQNRINQLTNQVEQLQHAFEKQKNYLEQSKSNSFLENRQYDLAMKSMLQSHYKEAERQFRAFILLYPQSKKNSDTYYWIGEINRKLGFNIIASKSYLTGAQKYPKGEKAVPSLFKATNLLIRMKKVKQACEVGKYLISNYSNKKNAEFIKKETIILRHAKCR